MGGDAGGMVNIRARDVGAAHEMGVSQRLCCPEQKAQITSITRLYRSVGCQPTQREVLKSECWCYLVRDRKREGARERERCIYMYICMYIMGIKIRICLYMYIHIPV